MGIEEEIRIWQNSVCVETMERSRFKAGDRIVDFGCGIGNYTFERRGWQYLSGESHPNGGRFHEIGNELF